MGLLGRLWGQVEEAILGPRPQYAKARPRPEPIPGCMGCAVFAIDDDALRLHLRQGHRK